MFLVEGKVERIYIIKNIDIEPKITNRLQVIGLTKGAKIEVLNKNYNSSFILKVRGTRFAIGKRVAQGIEVN